MVAMAQRYDTEDWILKKRFWYGSIFSNWTDTNQNRNERNHSVLEQSIQKSNKTRFTNESIHLTVCPFDQMAFNLLCIYTDTVLCRQT